MGDAEEFEDEVRRIARALWPSAEYAGAHKVDGAEHDGEFLTTDQVNAIECTVSRQLFKAEKDGAKLKKRVEALAKRYPYHAVKGWLVTREEPTADQREAIRKLRSPVVVALSFDQFRAKLIDAKAYLEARADYPFGSARAPDAGSFEDPGEYLPLDMVRAVDESLWDVDAVVRALQEHQRVLLLGDYGAGKSMTLRETYARLRKDYLRGRHPRFPVHLNLRDHNGQTDPAEALGRHARSIGFANPSHLVRAWRSGHVDLLLDGFDEMASLSWVGHRAKLKEARRRAVQLVREFLRQTPTAGGLMIAGREHYFDSAIERQEALGLGPTATELSLNDFTDEQVERYLSARGWNAGIPPWLPSRPLLLGYLAGRGLLLETLELDAGSSPAVGWHALLARITEREAEIEAGISGAAVRRLLERLATLARRDEAGLGPLSFADIENAFEAVVGYPPGEDSLVLLQRLPGLGVENAEDGSRQFIDDAFADVARAGDVFEWLVNPFDATSAIGPHNWQASLGSLGVEVVAYRWNSGRHSSGKLQVGLREATGRQWPTLASEAVRVIAETGGTAGTDAVYVSGAWVPELCFSSNGMDLAAVEFQDSLIQTLGFDPRADQAVIPRFVRCNFGTIEGAVGPEELPGGRFVDCEYEEFADEARTTNALLSLSNLPLPVRVMLTVLKKLYLQRGTGRRESALYRGLDHKARRHVDDVVDLLQKYELALPSKQGAETVWMPVRAEGARVRRLLASPSTSTDELMEAARELS